MSNQDDEAQLREVEILRSLNPTSFKNSARESYRRVVIDDDDDDDDDDDEGHGSGGGSSNGIINLIDFYPTPGHYRIVMELARGGDVFDRLAERKIYTEQTARDFAKSLFEAVSFLNGRGISHRDIKPENLLLMAREDDARGVRLADFGFARRYRDDRSSHHSGGVGVGDAEGTSMSTRCGTPAFVPPELVLGRRYGPKCDMWSAGCTLVRLLVGWLLLFFYSSIAPPPPSLGWLAGCSFPENRDILSRPACPPCYISPRSSCSW